MIINKEPTKVANGDIHYNMDGSLLGRKDGVWDVKKLLEVSAVSLEIQYTQVKM